MTGEWAVKIRSDGRPEAGCQCRGINTTWKQPIMDRASARGPKGLASQWDESGAFSAPASSVDQKDLAPGTRRGAKCHEARSLTIDATRHPEWTKVWWSLPLP